ncbi:ATP-dependent DNA helicase [Hylemonella gracilis]|uniref:ATP-dependent DNA helicase n=1 Tax=Hylemonella gracilis TaxID=80880 RepID=A0A4P6UK87_9BURK|nr:ATP-dependent DNA helicase [Hylemonella gracilis]QBK05592.1 ATP-dependent DNA helicase [Hylemonella gracilis]
MSLPETAEGQVAPALPRQVVADSLRAEVSAAFAEGGLLARGFPSFRARDGQTEMALAVADTLSRREVLVVEAGTGVGKTYAYLVPALLSGQRVMLSTATKTLQDQLHGRDLPRLLQLLGLPLRTALLKGRASYLCLHRLEQARQGATSGHAASGPSAHALSRIEQWARQTRTGDLAELPGLDERSPLIPLITSTRDNCLGQDCPRYRDCHVNLARREALAADLLVVNHHLFFADLAVRESGMAELLPTVDAVIFDEAHQLNETGVQFLGRQLSSSQVLDFARDLLATGLQQARGLADWRQLTGAIEHAIQDLRLCAGRAPTGGLRLSWSDATPERLNADAWAAALQGLQQACEDARAALTHVDELGPDFLRLADRARDLTALATFFLAPASPEAVRWLEVAQQLRLIESPLDIADTVRARLIPPVPDAAQDEPGHGTDGAPRAASRAWIFTSATLGDEETLRWFTEPCGLQDARVLRVRSPFDYARQAALYVPPVFPKPGEARHAEAVAALVARFAPTLGGRTLVLTTTLRALRDIGERLPELLAEAVQAPEGTVPPSASRLEVLCQGQRPKRELLERLRRGAESPALGCVLVASASFWEGVDIPGDALQLVVIDKLPFPPPGDPLVQARSRRLEAAQRSAFNDYHLPEAAVALKQGAGRLIRSESDRGLLVIGDPRLAQMGYGRRLLAGLPPMQRLGTEAEALAWLAALRAG